MHIHILGICGTFMGGVAVLAKQAGHRVSGSDAKVYPPMSTQLEAQGIALSEGYHPKHLQPAPDCVVIGNALSRGNPAVEYVLNSGLPYVSGPQWLGDHVLRGKKVIAVAGTHGKTTTSTLVAHVLEVCGRKPGFLIGGVPVGFDVSARLGEGEHFVVEADEYDTAFFDKRSKFLHYRPHCALLNNLEFDHADIFEDLAAIQKQFHHLVRIIPGNGRVIVNGEDANLQAVLDKGCWTPVERFALKAGAGREWHADSKVADGSSFDVHHQGRLVAQVRWNMTGQHNVANGLAAIAAAHAVGVPVAQAAEALCSFQGVKRRMEVRGTVRGITVYDDFAHHPTAIETTLGGLRARLGDAADIVAVLEPRSNTMRMGVHKGLLAGSLSAANRVVFYQPPDLGWSLDDDVKLLGSKASVAARVDDIVTDLARTLKSGTHVLVMSNGSFEGLHQKLLKALAA